MPSASKASAYTWRDLANHDDLLNALFVDTLSGGFPNHLESHKMNKNFRRPRADEKAVLDIVQRKAIVEGDIKGAVQELLGLDVIKKHHKGDELQRTLFSEHAENYFLIYTHGAGYEITPSDRYAHKTGKAELSLVATIPRKPGDILDACRGTLVRLSAQDELDLRGTAGSDGWGEGGQDWSVITSQAKGPQIFLGPARFANHDCSNNVVLHRVGNYLTLKVVKPISVGDEILVFYGKNYFGENNKECLCATCEANGRGGFADPNHPDVTLAEQFLHNLSPSSRRKLSLRKRSSMSALAAPAPRCSSSRSTSQNRTDSSERAESPAPSDGSSALTPPPDESEEDGPRRLLDWKYECRTCKGVFKPEDPIWIPWECHRCERHRKLFGFGWPERPKKGVPIPDNSGRSWTRKFTEARRGPRESEVPPPPPPQPPPPREAAAARRASVTASVPPPAPAGPASRTEKRALTGAVAVAPKKAAASRSRKSSTAHRASAPAPLRQEEVPPPQSPSTQQRKPLKRRGSAGLPHAPLSPSPPPPSVPKRTDPNRRTRAAAPFAPAPPVGFLRSAWEVMEPAKADEQEQTHEQAAASTSNEAAPARPKRERKPSLKVRMRESEADEIPVPSSSARPERRSRRRSSAHSAQLEQWEADESSPASLSPALLRPLSPPLYPQSLAHMPYHPLALPCLPFAPPRLPSDPMALFDEPDKPAFALDSQQLRALPPRGHLGEPLASTSSSVILTDEPPRSLSPRLNCSAPQPPSHPISDLLHPQSPLQTPNEPRTACPVTEYSPALVPAFLPRPPPPPRHISVASTRPSSRTRSTPDPTTHRAISHERERSPQLLCPRPAPIETTHVVDALQQAAEALLMRETALPAMDGGADEVKPEELAILPARVEDLADGAEGEGGGGGGGRPPEEALREGLKFEVDPPEQPASLRASDTLTVSSHRPSTAQFAAIPDDMRTRSPEHSYRASPPREVPHYAVPSHVGPPSTVQSRIGTTQLVEPVPPSPVPKLEPETPRSLSPCDPSEVFLTPRSTRRKSAPAKTASSATSKSAKRKRRTTMDDEGPGPKRSSAKRKRGGGAPLGTPPDFQAGLWKVSHPFILKEEDGDDGPEAATQAATPPSRPSALSAQAFGPQATNESEAPLDPVSYSSPDPLDCMASPGLDRTPPCDGDGDAAEVLLSLSMVFGERPVGV